MTGKLLAGLIIMMGLLGGIAMYYFQEVHFYEEIKATGVDDVQMTLLVTDQPEAILYENFKAIDADSSPIRYRACFTTTMSHPMLSETYVAYDKAVPLVAPKQFDCFDAKEVGLAIEQGKALAFMGTENFHYGIDRVVAVMEDGRGFVWHQINHCGEKAFDGLPVPEGCPPVPEK